MFGPPRGRDNQVDGDTWFVGVLWHGGMPALPPCYHPPPRKVQKRCGGTVSLVTSWCWDKVGDPSKGVGGEVDRYLKSARKSGRPHVHEHEWQASEGCRLPRRVLELVAVNKRQSSWNHWWKVEGCDKYGVSWSLWCGTTMQATNQKLKAWVIDMNNHWRKVERAGGRQVHLSMREHYTEIQQSVSILLEFLSAR